MHTETREGLAKLALLYSLTTGFGLAGAQVASAQHPISNFCTVSETTPAYTRAGVLSLPQDGLMSTFARALSTGYDFRVAPARGVGRLSLAVAAALLVAAETATPLPDDQVFASFVRVCARLVAFGVLGVDDLPMAR
jgi:hypothetical protein